MGSGLLGDLYVWSYSSWDDAVRNTLGTLYPMQGVDTWHSQPGITTFHLSTFCPQGQQANTLNSVLAAANGRVTASWVCNRWQNKEVL